MKKTLVTLSLFSAFLSYNHSVMACPDGCHEDIFNMCECGSDELVRPDKSKIDLTILEEGQKIEVLTKDKGEHITVQKKGDKLILVK